MKPCIILFNHTHPPEAPVITNRVHDKITIFYQGLSEDKLIVYDSLNIFSLRMKDSYF